MSIQVCLIVVYNLLKGNDGGEWIRTTDLLVPKCTAADFAQRGKPWLTSDER